VAMGSPGGDGGSRGRPCRTVSLTRPRATRVGTGEGRRQFRNAFQPLLGVLYVAYVRLHITLSTPSTPSLQGRGLNATA
jgi:hypothetical protein